MSLEPNNVRKIQFLSLSQSSIVSFEHWQQLFFWFNKWNVCALFTQSWCSFKMIQMEEANTQTHSTNSRIHIQPIVFFRPCFKHNAKCLTANFNVVVSAVTFISLAATIQTVAIWKLYQMSMHWVRSMLLRNEFECGRMFYFWSFHLWAPENILLWFLINRKHEIWWKIWNKTLQLLSTIIFYSNYLPYFDNKYAKDTKMLTFFILNVFTLFVLKKSINMLY